MLGKLPTGITRTKYGYRAFIRVRDRLYSKRFKPETPIPTMRDWRQAKRVDVLRAARSAPPPEASVFRKDVDQYLLAVKAMTSYADRERDMLAWVEHFGDRDRHTITSADIRAVLQRWRLSGRKDGKPLSESACNHRRSALMHFYAVMNGKSGENPVRDVPKFREPDPAPRGLRFAQLAKVFKAMPESTTKARAMILAYTGLPNATLMRLTASDVDFKAKTVTVPRRRKGAGTHVRVLPLTPQAVKAFKLLDRYDGWGHFSRASLRQSLQRACRTAKVTLIRTYDLRHSFGTEAYARTGDIGAVQALLDHADAKMTRRYTLKAIDERVKKAVAALAKGHQ